MSTDTKETKHETKETKQKELTTEMKVAQQLFSTVSQGNKGKEVWESIVHDNFQFKHPKFPSLNKQQFIDVHFALAAAFPNLDYGVNPAEWEQLTERKGLKATYRFTGIHTGAGFTPFQDCPEIAATQIRVALPDEHTIIIVENGKIVEIDVDENNTLLSGPIGFYISIGGKMPRPAQASAATALSSPLASSAPASSSFSAAAIAASVATTSSTSASTSASASTSSASVSATADILSTLTVDNDDDD